MVSRGAQRVYLTGALLNFALLATAIGVGAAVSVGEDLALPPVTDLLIRILFFPEVLGTAVLLVGMSYFGLVSTALVTGRKPLGLRSYISCISSRCLFTTC